MGFRSLKDNVLAVPEIKRKQWDYSGFTINMVPEDTEEDFRVYSADFYLRESTSDEVFPVEEPKQVRDVIEVPMPFIEDDPSKPDVVYVTEDWYFKEKRKWIARRVREKKDVQIEMMDLITYRDRLRWRLGLLDPKDPKNEDKIITLNVKIRNMECKLEGYRWEYQVSLDEIDYGMRLAHFVRDMKKRAKKVVKKIKKFFRKHDEVISNVLTYTLPVIFTFIAKKIVLPLIL